MSLTPAELAQFEDEGYVVKAGVYTAEDLEPIRRAIAEMIDVAARVLHGEGRLSDPCAGEGFERRLAAVREIDEEAAREIYGRILGKGGGGFSGPEMLDLLRHPGLLSCVESLVGPDIVGSSVYRIRPKVPGWAHGEVPWHQDSGYFAAHCDRFLIVTCWIPLVDATQENGCLYVLPRRHREGVLRHYTGGHGNFLEIPVNELHPEGAVPLEMHAGDVLLMTNLTPHASFANRTDRVRWSVDLRYQSAEAPNNLDEDPEQLTAQTQRVSVACYPPEADFVIRDRAHPEREVRRPEDFHALRRRYEQARPHYPGRGWTPMVTRQIP